MAAVACILLGTQLAALAATAPARVVEPPDTIAPADAQSRAIVAAARDFLATLEDQERSGILFEYSDDEQRQRWSNLPARSYPRKGARWGDLSPVQQEAFWKLLGQLLSSRGVEMVRQQLWADEHLAQNRRSGPAFGLDLYWIAFLGEPSENSAWMLQFGGHHLALNATVAGPHVTLAPSLTGGQPVRFEWEGRRIEILGSEIEALSKLVGSLSEAQRRTAHVDAERSRLVLGPGREGLTIVPSGLKGSDLDAGQRELLMDLVEERIGILNPDDASPRLAQIRADLDHTHLALFGDLSDLRGAYWRIVGPTVVIEYSPENLGGDRTQHIHSMMREPGNDYGAAWARRPPASVSR